MSNLTITVDDEALRRARIRALEQGTSVNAVLREFLEAYAGGGVERARAVDRVLEVAARYGTGSGGRPISRDDLHERS